GDSLGEREGASDDGDHGDRYSRPTRSSYRTVPCRLWDWWPGTESNRRHADFQSVRALGRRFFIGPHRPVSHAGQRLRTPCATGRGTVRRVAPDKRGTERAQQSLAWAGVSSGFAIRGPPESPRLARSKSGPVP